MVRWPWVSREMYETADRAFSEMCAAFNRQSDLVDQLRTDFRQQLEYNRVLVQFVVDLRRDGFVPPPKPEARSAEAQRRASMEETIRLVSQDRKAAEITRAWVNNQRLAGIDDEEIWHALLQPLPDEGEGVPV